MVSMRLYHPDEWKGRITGRNWRSMFTETTQIGMGDIHSFSSHWSEPSKSQRDSLVAFWTGLWDNSIDTIREELLPEVTLKELPQVYKKQTILEPTKLQDNS